MTTILTPIENTEENDKTPIVATEARTIAAEAIVIPEKNNGRSEMPEQLQQATSRSAETNALKQVGIDNWYQREQAALALKKQLEEEFISILTEGRDAYEQVLGKMVAAIDIFEQKFNGDGSESPLLKQIQDGSWKIAEQGQKLNKILNSPEKSLDGKLLELIQDPNTPNQLRDKLGTFYHEKHQDINNVGAELKTIEAFRDRRLEVSKEIVTEPIRGAINPLRHHVEFILEMSQFPEGKAIPAADIEKVEIMEKILAADLPAQKLEEIKKILFSQKISDKTVEATSTKTSEENPAQHTEAKQQQTVSAPEENPQQTSKGVELQPQQIGTAASLPPCPDYEHLQSEQLREMRQISKDPEKIGRLKEIARANGNQSEFVLAEFEKRGIPRSSRITNILGPNIKYLDGYEAAVIDAILAEHDEQAKDTEQKKN